MNKIKISTSQLSKFKITADNCDIFMRLEFATNWMYTDNLDLYVNELLVQGLKFQTIRSRNND